jgi:hypothetical protein
MSAGLYFQIQAVQRVERRESVTVGRMGDIEP